MDAKINLKLGSSIDLVGHVSLKKNLDNICKIYCEKGSIKIPSPWLPSQKSFIEIVMLREAPRGSVGFSASIIIFALKSVP